MLLPLYTIVLLIQVKALFYFHNNFVNISWRQHFCVNYTTKDRVCDCFPDTPSELLQRPIIERLN